MNIRKKKKKRKKLYKDLIEDIALEISLDEYWRKKIMKQLINTKIEITYRNLSEIPEYIKKDMMRYKLEFWVMRVSSCKEHFDENLIIFKFDEEKCIGVRCILKGEPIKSDKENLKKNYIADDFSSITNIHIEEDTISYNLNIWNGKTISEVKDIIYENYPSASIEEY